MVAYPQSRRRQRTGGAVVMRPRCGVEAEEDIMTTSNTGRLRPNEGMTTAPRRRDDAETYPTRRTQKEVEV